MPAAHDETVRTIIHAAPLRRFTAGQARIERRSADSAPIISGYAAVFYDPQDPGTEYRIMDDMVERIMPGAFDETLRDCDCRCLFNHDANHLLGRTAAGTCRLAVDRRGLKYENDTDPSNPQHAAVVSMLERGDLDGSSFSFYATSSTWREETTDGETLYIREITAAELVDVGPVTFPAYAGTTSSAARSEDLPSARAALDAYLADRQHAAERDAASLARRLAAYRARSVEVDSID